MDSERSRLLSRSDGELYTGSRGSYTSIGVEEAEEEYPRPSSVQDHRTRDMEKCRRRTISFSMPNEAGDDIVSTSFGPVVVLDDHRPRNLMLGWFLAIISGILFTANNFFVKYLNLNPIEMLLIRSFLQTVLIAVGLLSSKSPFLPEHRKDKILVILQGLLSGGRILFQFACLTYMPLGDALTLVFTEPLWTILLSKLVLKIPIGVWKGIFGAILISGMVLTIQPEILFHNQGRNAYDPCNNSSEGPFSNESEHNGLGAAPYMLDDLSLFSNFTRLTGLRTLRLNYVETLRNRSNCSMDETDAFPNNITESDGDYYKGVGLALGTAILGSLANVIISKCEEVSSSIMVFYSGLGGVILGIIMCAVNPENRIMYNIGEIPYDEWLILFGLGASGIAGYYAMTMSLQMIPPTTVAVLRALEIILAYVAQAAVMREIPDCLAISGSSLVMFSVIGFALEDTILNCLCPTL